MGKVKLTGRAARPSRTHTQGDDRFQKVLEKVQQERENRERNRVKNLLSLKSA